MYFLRKIKNKKWSSVLQSYIQRLLFLTHSVDFKSIYVYLFTLCVCICICVLRRNFRIAFIQKTLASLDESNKASWIRFSFSREESLDWPHLHKSKGSRHLGPGGKIQQNFLEPDKILPSLHLLICRGSICGKGGQIFIKVSEPPGRKENWES